MTFANIFVDDGRLIHRFESVRTVRNKVWSTNVPKDKHVRNAPWMLRKLCGLFFLKLDRIQSKRVKAQILEIRLIMYEEI